MSTTAASDLLTAAGAAELLGVQADTVRQLIHRGRLAGRKPGRDWLVERSEVERYRQTDRRPGRKARSG